MTNSQPDAEPVADPSQNACVGSGFQLVDPSHPRVGLHSSQTRRTGDKNGSTPLPDAKPSKAARAAAWQAWEDAGKPWNPEQDQPPGAVLDHALDACAADPMNAKWRR